MAKEKILGIDVGSRNIKMALINQDKKLKAIIDTAVIPIPEEIITMEETQKLEKIAQLIKGGIADRNIKVKKLSFSINSPQVVVRSFQLPSIKKKEIHEAILMDLSKTFQDITNTHAISYKVYQHTKEGIEGMVAFCPKKLVEGYVYLASLIGIPAKYVDVNANSITKAYKTFISHAKPDENVIVVDIGAKYSQVNVIEKDQLLLSRIIACGGGSIDKAVAKHLNISLEQAEKDKFNKFMEYEIQGYDAEGYIKRGYSPIVQEINQTIAFYNQKKKDTKINRILLIGGGSLLYGMEEYLKEGFSVPASTIKPTDNNAAYIKEFPNLLPAIGAALREDS